MHKHVNMKREAPKRDSAKAHIRITCIADLGVAQKKSCDVERPKQEKCRDVKHQSIWTSARAIGAALCRSPHAFFQAVVCRRNRSVAIAPIIATGAAVEAVRAATTVAHAAAATATVFRAGASFR